MFSTFFLNYCLVIFASCSYCTIFQFTAELIFLILITSKKAKAEIEIHPLITEVKIKKGSIKIRVVTHQFILLYFFNEIVSSMLSIYFKFLAYK